jgi:hypothetical protein
LLIWNNYIGVAYSPQLDSWRTISDIGAPTDFVQNSVWTGNEMFTWAETGGQRYNPSLDEWTDMSPINSPEVGINSTLVWTGEEMIVWGGNTVEGSTDKGGRYNPQLDSWIATACSQSPSPRIKHTAVWTGAEMIIWGGVSPHDSTNIMDTGSCYTPSLDTWIDTATPPVALEPRIDHSAIWNGTDMIIWGGRTYPPAQDFDTGARYNPGTNSWLLTTTTNCPLARSQHTAVWNGTYMIIWGGTNDTSGELNDGKLYNCSDYKWYNMIATSLAPRKGHSAVWTGKQMIIWVVKRKADRPTLMMVPVTLKVVLWNSGRISPLRGSILGHIIPRSGLTPK